MLDRLPLQGIPGTWQGRLFPAGEVLDPVADTPVPDSASERPGPDEMGDFFA